MGVDMSFSEYKYWYAFCFMNTNETGQTYGTCYRGLDVRGVRMCDIAEAKEVANMPNESVMISCSLLGLMTREAFTGDDID